MDHINLVGICDITATKQSTTKLCVYFMGRTVGMEYTNIHTHQDCLHAFRVNFLTLIRFFLDDLVESSSSSTGDGGETSEMEHRKNVEKEHNTCNRN